MSHQKSYSGDTPEDDRVAENVREYNQAARDQRIKDAYEDYWSSLDTSILIEAFSEADNQRMYDLWNKANEVRQLIANLDDGESYDSYILEKLALLGHFVTKQIDCYFKHCAEVLSDY